LRRDTVHCTAVSATCEVPPASSAQP
jgi:hypothetical protein